MQNALNQKSIKKKLVFSSSKGRGSKGAFFFWLCLRHRFELAGNCSTKSPKAAFQAITENLFLSQSWDAFISRFYVCTGGAESIEHARKKNSLSLKYRWAAYV